MAGVNRTTLLGNLGTDPEVRQTRQGTPVCRFRLATSERRRDAEGKVSEATEWHNVVVFGRTAQTCAAWLKKGRQVYVEGCLRTRSWQDQEGQTRHATEVVCRDVQFLGPRTDDGAEAPGADAAIPGPYPEEDLDEHAPF
jgi:single-strand DNA-binding protein